jgi:hypothetical protein
MNNYYRSLELYVTGGWRKLHKENLHNMLSSQSIIRRTNSKRMKCAGHVTRVRRGRHVRMAAIFTQLR